MHRRNVGEPKHSVSAQKPRTKYQHGGGGMMIWAYSPASGSRHFAVDHKLLSIQKYSRVKCLVMCLTAQFQQHHEPVKARKPQ